MKTGFCALLLMAFSSLCLAGVEGVWQCNSTYKKQVMVGGAYFRSAGSSSSTLKFNPDKTYVDTDLTQPYPETGDWRQHGRKLRLRPNLLNIQANYLSDCSGCRYLGATIKSTGKLNRFSTVIRGKTRLNLLSLEKNKLHRNRVVTTTTCYRD